MIITGRPVAGIACAEIMKVNSNFPNCKQQKVSSDAN